MSRKGFRFSLFKKILLSCLTLSGLMILAMYLWQHYYYARQEGRGRFLEAHLKRYQQYQRGMSQAVYSTAAILAEDQTLRQALSSGGSLEAAAARAQELYATLMAKNALNPELFVMFNSLGHPVFLPEKSPLQPADLKEFLAMSRVRTGGHFFDKLILHENRVYVAAGIPIHRAGGEETVGGLILGIPLERYFEEYKSQSDDLEKNQLRLSLVRDDDVLTSVLARDKWDELVEALHPDRRQHVKDGADTIEILGFDGQTWDFYSATVPGYMGNDNTSNLGTLYVMKTRQGLKERAGFGPAALTGIGLAVVIALLLAWWITSPVKSFIRATAAISSGGGDLTKRVDVDSNDELGDLAHNLNDLFAHLHTLAGEVQNASFQVGASSAEISAASKQMLEGAKDQAVKIEGSTAAVTELSTSIQQVASNAIETTKVAKQSNEAVAQAVDSMNHIRATVEDAAEKMRELGESGKRIGNIVEVIRQISEQTSLLALNASIEAAHAGEQGRGFAVVADEVSSLAKRVGQSAKDIEDLIATIKDQTTDAVTAMLNGTREVESGTQLVSNTLANLKQIIEVIQDTANAVQEQAIVSDEIARNMDAVQKIANEVLASSEEAVIQGEQLHQLAHQLEESVRGFKIDGEASAGRALPPAPRPEAALPPPGRTSGAATGNGKHRAARAAAGGKPEPRGRG
jgi:methyl-accepting chemotaxis protein